MSTDFSKLLVAAAALFLATAAAAGPRYLIGVGLSGDDEAGVSVSHVEPGSPAATAALEAGDRILQVNQAEIAAPEQVIAALQGRESGVSLLRVKRGETVFFAPVRPERWPDPDRDAALFPYQDDAGAPRSALSARIAGRDYPVLESAEVFNWAKMLGVDAPTGRVAFRARLARCGDLATLRGVVQQPGAGLLYPIRSARSPLFDFDVAQAEKAACEAYMEANGLSWSSPRVVIAGRFVDDAEARVSEGGMVLLVDAALFDHGHVTLGEQLWSAVQLVESVGLLGE